MPKLTRQSGCVMEQLTGSFFGAVVLVMVGLLLVTSMTEAAGMCAGAATAMVLGFVGILYVFTIRRPSLSLRPVEEILAEVDLLDEEEASEEAFQPLFDDLLLHVVTGPKPDLDSEIVRRMNTCEGPSRRMFLQLAAVHPGLQKELRILADSAHPLAPEAKELLKRRSERS